MDESQIVVLGQLNINFLLVFHGTIVLFLMRHCFLKDVLS